MTETRSTDPGAGSSATLTEMETASPALRSKLDQLSPEKRALLARRLQQKREGAGATAEGIPRLPRVGPEPAFPLSFAQQRLWFLDRFEPGSAFYNGHFALRFSGRLDAGRLAVALDGVVRRHEVLRTTYAERDGEPVQVVHPPAARLPLPLLDLGALPEGLRGPEAGRLARAESRRPFDLERGPVLRATLLRLAPEEHLLVVVAHHVAVDNWSAGVMTAELSALYGALAEGREAELPELPVQYADFAVWQRGRLEGGLLEAQLGFWRRQLAGAPALLQLPSDRPRPARQGFRGARAGAVLPPSLAASLRALARRRDATPYMLLLAAFQALLFRYTGAEDLVVGTPVAGRLRPEVEPLIGFFVNTLPLRARVAADLPFPDLVDRARGAALDAFAHQEVPFERLVDALAPERSLGHAPLVQVLFNLLNVPPRVEELPGLRLQAVPVEAGTARFDLELYLEEQPQGLLVDVHYDTDLFDAATALRLLRHLGVLLGGIAERPDEAVGELPLLTAGEGHQLLAELDDTAAPLPAWTVPARFAAQAARTPDAPAVVLGESGMTYRELAGEAARLARRLAELGVGPEVLVAVSLPRTPALAAALLGVLAAAGGYVPLDPAYPGERLAAVLEDSRPRVLVTTAELADGLFAGLPAAAVPERIVRLDAEDLPAAPWPAGAVAPENLAYVLFTSGSTGRPKGVEVPHGALANFLASAAGSLGLPTGGRLLAVTSVSFDIAALDLFLPLITGGCVELATAAEAMDGTWLAARLAAEPRVDALQATPATWRLLLEMGWSGSPGLVAMCGGETFPRSLASAVAARSAALWNFYGPTEATVWSSCHRLGAEEAGPVSIGLPLANVRQHVLDAGLRPVPLGVPGELYVAGAGLARGYRGRPDLTAERFVPDPLAAEPGSRLYRTGDLVRWFEGGRGLEVMGRLDHQVKVRGFRIELGEIEATLTRHPRVREAVAAVRGGGGREPYLAAWIVPADGRIPDAAELRLWLARTLPDYMLPAAFVPLPELPLTPNRKVDRKALPDPGPEAEGRADEGMGPASPVEEVVRALWAEVLGTERVGSGDDFFALGGHSLLAGKVTSRVRRDLGVDLPLRTLFEAPTPAAFARRVEEEIRKGAGAARDPIGRAPRTGPLPLSFPQRRLWYLDQLDPGSAAYNLATAVRLEGELDRGALAAAFAEVVRRHEILRTSFPTAGDEPVQAIREEVSFRPAFADLSALPEAAREAELRRLAWEETQRPFDLARGPLLRAVLLRLGPGEHALLATLHHIVGDAWSLGVLVNELGALYGAFREGRPSPLPEPPLQYADFAVWQRGWLEGEACARALAWWRERLAGAPALALPTDHPRRPGEPIRPARQPVAVPAGVQDGMAALARACGATPFLALVAGFVAVLGAEGRSEDVVVGSNVANRNRLETEGLIGFFVNLLVLRADLSGDPTFRELLRRVRDVALAAWVHQDLPFDRLVQELGAAGAAGASDRAPLFQAKVDLVPALPLDGRFPDLALHPLDAGKITARYDLHLEMAETPDGLRGALIYDAGLFEAATAARLAGRLERLLREAAAAPDLRLSEMRERLAQAEREERQEKRRTRLGLDHLQQIRRRPLPAGRAAASPDQDR